MSLSNATIDFNKNAAVINAPLVKIDDTAFGVNSTISANFKNGLIVKNLNVKSKYFNADTLLMDENAGRKIAKSMGIHIMGSIGIIIAAYDMGIINADDVRMSVEKIKEANRWISNTLLQYTLDYVNKNASS